jgi:hypothetical protein
MVVNRKQEPEELSITAAMMVAAWLNPCGWVTLFEGHYPSEQKPPLEAIVGWWPVDARGNIIAEDYMDNPSYRARGLPLSARGKPALAWLPECEDALMLPEPETKYLH